MSRVIRGNFSKRVFVSRLAVRVGTAVNDQEKLVASFTGFPEEDFSACNSLFKMIVISQDDTMAAMP